MGIFGLLGSEAASVTPQAAPLTFDPIATAATRMVADLRNNDKVDLVIALSHSGIYSNGTGEDAVLAQAVPGIDVIVSGHTHDALTQPKQVGSTWIVTAGKYGENLGNLQLTVTKGAKAGRSGDGRAGRAYMLQPMDDTVPGDRHHPGGASSSVHRGRSTPRCRRRAHLQGAGRRDDGRPGAADVRRGAGRQPGGRRVPERRRARCSRRRRP